ncbi:MAG: hypothetical protein AABW48_02450 [Nanoarchaeota archaeon]
MDLKKNKTSWFLISLIIFTLSFIAVILVLIVGKDLTSPLLQCSTIDTVDSIVTVKTAELPIVGLNTDTDGLKFGVVSPTASVKRTIKVAYTKPAAVNIQMDGDLQPWVAINPAEFEIEPNQTITVEFIVSIPEEAADGNYTGKVLFCYKDE